MLRGWDAEGGELAPYGAGGGAGWLGPSRI
jgi:hypothetical protein